MEKDRLTALVMDSLDSGSDPDELARRAYQSRASFFRLFQALVEETPGGMRRRLLLERAAWQLGSSQATVTEIALDAGYQSLEAFSRTFRKAFGQSPSLYRRTGSGRIHLPAPSHFHFRPPIPKQKGTTLNMDLFDLFAGTDSWYTQKLLRQAGALSSEQLDRPVNGTAKIFGWDKPDKNLREILERMVQIKELWIAAATGGELPKLEGRRQEERTPEALLQRFELADAEFHRVLKAVRDRGGWDDTFVDALCEPPETFTYGGMFAHVVTFNTYRRMAALDQMDRLGVPIEGQGDPIEYQMSMGMHARK
jgi:AraC-like DNA-binding protein